MSLGMFTGRRMVSGFIPRSCHEPGGFGYMLRQGACMEPMPMRRETAGWRTFIGGGCEEVLWSELMDQKRERQREQLARVLQVPEPRWQRAQVWVFYNSHWIYSGWHCYVRTVSAVQRRFDMKAGATEGGRLGMHLMQTIPVGVLAMPGWREFAAWCEAVAKAYPKRRTKSDPRKAGIVNGWWDNERGLWFWEKTQDQERERMLRSLHRCGDHTLDPEPNKEVAR